MGSAETSGLRRKFHGIFSWLFSARSGIAEVLIDLSKAMYSVQPITRVLRLTALAATLCAQSPAQAEDKPEEVRFQAKQDISADTPIEPFRLAEAPEKVTGMVEVSLGWLTLPGAQVCGPESCKSGDTTPVVEIWNLIHLDWGLAFGAGVSLGLIPTANTPQTGVGLERENSRSYLTFEGVARYYPAWAAPIDLWLGTGLGLALVNDRFASEKNSSSQIRIGTPGFTLRSEALSYFAGGGLSYALDRRWHIGTSARVGRFELPNTPERSPLGDEATIVGPTVFAVATLNVSVHAEL